MSSRFGDDDILQGIAAVKLPGWSMCCMYMLDGRPVQHHSPLATAVRLTYKNYIAQLPASALCGVGPALRYTVLPCKPWRADRKTRA